MLPFLYLNTKSNQKDKSLFIKFFHCRGGKEFFCRLHGRPAYFIKKIYPCRVASLSFGLRKRVTRESNLRGVSAIRSSPLKYPLSFSARALARTAPRVRFSNNAVCGTMRVVRVPQQSIWIKLSGEQIAHRFN